MSTRSKLSYIPATDDDQAAMCDAIGVSNIDQLFQQIPEGARLERPLKLPPGLAEQDVLALGQSLASRNRHMGDLVSFLGAGVYDRYIPALVDAVISRSEFATTYTPYQPESSQGLLQTIYEYQSMIAALTAMDVSNASLYDAATAVGEAAIMAFSITGRARVLVSRAVHPHYRQVLATYTSGIGIDVSEIPYSEGVTDVEAMRAALDDGVACVIVQYPNFFGGVEPLRDIAQAAHEAGALLIVSVDPIALGLLTPPGAYGADIVVGEGQPLGIATGFGGPFLGLFACRREHLRKMPGRVVGATVDADGQVAYTLTLQTREQHIRREKATSNICTNQALMALAATVYLSALGKNGLRQVAELSFQKAHYAQKQILARKGYSSTWSVPFINEFVIKTDEPVAQINRRLLEHGVLGGLDLGKYYSELENHMLLCVTERRSRAQIDRLVELL
ncbi:MAG: aminomethyl-transferring glycine dehydrogenase subunit GcvPA [Armatimonadetes bacterium]|nr:aminomethyl-transferring glycine dehydrogenase subunit GcvPA [Armatimonadota bacterium]